MNAAASHPARRSLEQRARDYEHHTMFCSPKQSGMNRQPIGLFPNSTMPTEIRSLLSGG